LSSVFRFSISLALIRLWSATRYQEHFSLFLLVLVQLSATTLRTTSVLWSIVLLGFLVTGPLHLTFVLSASNLEALPASAFLTSPPLLPTSRILSLIGPTALFALLIFLIFPRTNSSGWSLARHQGVSLTGLSEQLSLGNIGQIQNDPKVILRFEVSHNNPLPEHLPWLFRAASFESTDGHTWFKRGDNHQHTIYLNRLEPLFLKRPPHAGDLVMHILLESIDPPLVLIPNGAVAIAFSSPIHLMVLEQGELKAPILSKEPIRYTAWIERSKTPSPTPLPLICNDCLSIPPGHEAVVAFAESLLQGVQDPREKVARILNYMHSPPFRYSLDMRDPGQRPPLLAFLFDWKEGHCEYFASATALLLRAAQIPSRVVTGFRGGHYNPYGQYYGVRASDAHAWVEAYLGEEGWVVLDPTPPATSAVHPQMGWWLRLQHLVDAWEWWWQSAVIEYHQNSLSRAWKEWASGPRWQKLTKPKAIALLLTASGLLLLALRLFHRPLIPKSRDRLALIHDEFEALLRLWGCPRPPHQTPLEHLDTLKGSGFPDIDCARNIVEFLYSCRYGNTPHDLKQLEAAEACLKSLRSKCQKAVELERKSRLNSFLRAKVVRNLRR
ncbi:MAG: DUF3488 and transglutaminase-like domain-containing protein, partial [Sandaracinaceae bacterium]|nr:DUF3488 and transglutaminase-like domain-containing protein [Sandaracinaceae bacterium]